MTAPLGAATPLLLSGPCWLSTAAEPAVPPHRTTAPMTPAVRIKRIYDPPAPHDGARVLVDRLWPRGVSKARAALTLWCRDVAPSTALRRWFGHDPARWAEFRRRYRAELRGHGLALAPIWNLIRQGPVTLIFAARDEHHNEAVVLREFLMERPESEQ